PLDHLVEGDNTFEGNCDESGGFGWGQWGLYALTLRVYYDPALKTNHEVDARITSPLSGQTIKNNPEIAISASAKVGVSRIDVLARYDGYDEDGDGRHGGFHESRFQLVNGGDNEVRDHVGTLWSEPHRLVWQTRYVPDQPAGSVALVARVQDSRGYWSVSPIVDSLTLDRAKVSVRTYRATGVPEDFSVRVGETKTCMIRIPEDADLQSAASAVLHLRTWHGWDGHHDPIKINDHAMPINGKNHFYDYDLREFPVSALRIGDNTFTIQSQTEHHMLEVLWPGPAITVRYEQESTDDQASKPSERNGVSIRETQHLGRPHFVAETPAATYYLDAKSGGLSRLIDPDGEDWIAFSAEPWDEYPASSASSFRGLPNLLFGKEHSGFGHPGHDTATTKLIDQSTIQSITNDERWILTWRFDSKGATLDVETRDDTRQYWFLYEGPIAGRFAPHRQYFATSNSMPRATDLDFIGGDVWTGECEWAYFGDQDVQRVLVLESIASNSRSDRPTSIKTGNAVASVCGQLGETKTDRLDSNDGMIVFGFGRGPKGIDPMLVGNRKFRIRFIEQSGASPEDYKKIKRALRLP
ncbi:MAG: hypothetical protein AAF802_16755, partial [Planctomycetota bacterium]